MRVAAIQMTSSKSVDANLASAQRLFEQAAQDGAELVVLPENFALYGRGGLRAEAEAEAAGSGPVLPFVAKMARQHKLWVVAGTIPYVRGINGELAPEPKVFAGCALWSPEGVVVSRYDKCHLFDVDVADGVGRYRESDFLCPGSEPVCADTALGRVGLSVCYDLRFAEYYRVLVEMGAQLVVVPSAFTFATGEAHWEVLLRARAIENQVFVVAANQGGEHKPGRRTWGHSCIVDPWGRMLAQADAEGPGVVCADIDLSQLDRVRKNMPIAEHRKFR